MNNGIAVEKQWKMLLISLILFAHASANQSFQTLFPEQNRLYTFALKSNVSAGTVSPITDGSFWTLNGELSVQVYDDFSRARLQLDQLETSIHVNSVNSSHKSEEAVKQLSTPWEFNVCFSSIHVGVEPTWVTNIKRALSFNLLLAEPKGASTSSEEPCLQGNCIVIYSRVGNKTKKYTSLVDYKRNRLSTYEQRCLPNRSPDAWYRPSYSDDLSNVMTAERLYEVDDKDGLREMELRSEFQYRTHDHILSVLTELSLTQKTTRPMDSISKLNLSESTMQYATQTHSDPTNGIRNPEQGQIKNLTYQLLINIARKGIDADNIVRNATLIHSLDFIELLTKMSQLNYTSLSKLFEDVLGTSYELETSRNIFLEILPYVRTEASARLIRHLIIEQKAKIEDAVLISLIRKLPYNLVDFSRPLLEELEVFTKLPPDFPQEIRHAGILSFATLVHKTMEMSFDQQYFDEIYDKYLRMFNNCPQYLDRLVWLQGLTNIGKGVVHYLDEIHTDAKKDRHERLWAALASLSIWKSSTLENTLPILMNATEHIQLRAVALHAFLSSPVGARDFLNVHNYVKSSKNDQLKRFWYTTVKSLESNRFYNRYKSASYYIPFVANQVSNPPVKYWATNNYIISQEPTLDIQGPTMQLLTVGEGWGGPPQLAMLELSTGGDTTFNTAIYIIAEGVTSNVFKRLHSADFSAFSTDQILALLKRMDVKPVGTEKVHIDIVVKVHDKTVYATHIDQDTFDSWNAVELKKSIEDFVRFGSHINQQIVNYPVQNARDFSTEIGTPVRLHSTIVSFTSLRGNLTAPSTEDLMSWRNDLHIRYQGTSVTSVSTDGPLHPSEHTARIQQSLVLHLPIKFDVSLSHVVRSLELKWTNPAQNGGIAMHSRVQIVVDSTKGVQSHTVRDNAKQKDDDGIYFDCENPKSGSEISQMLTSKKHNIFTSLQPSQLILNSIRLLTSPPSGSCGLILPPHQLEAGNILQLVMKMETLQDEGQGYWSEIGVRISYALSYYRQLEAEDPDTYLAIKGYTDVQTDGRNGRVQMELNFVQPHAVDRHWKNWTMCLEEHHKIDPNTFEIDFTSRPASLEGHISINMTSENDFHCFVSEPSSAMDVDFNSAAIKGNQPRYLQVRLRGKNLPELDFDPSSAADSYIARLLNSLRDPSPQHFSYSESMEGNGPTKVNFNVETIQFKLKYDHFTWLPGTLSALQILRKLGFYHECRILPSKAKTFSGSIVPLTDPYRTFLVAGDCNDKPRFAVTQSILRKTLNVHSGDKFVAYYWDSEDAPRLNSTEGTFTPDIRVTTRGKELFLRSPSTGVHIYYKPRNETVVLVPHAHMATICGVCTGHFYYDL